MSLLRSFSTWFQIICLQFIYYTCTHGLNDYTKDYYPDKEVWRSLSDFVPEQSISHGSIKLGQVMSVEFDWIWHKRTDSPRLNRYENFFRVGLTAKNGNQCDGEGSRLPSFWLTADRNSMHVSVADIATCQPYQSCNSYGNITAGVSYHVKIAFNTTKLVVEITNNDEPVKGGWQTEPDWNKTWDRTPFATEYQYLGQQMPVWWMSDKNSGSPYNVGDGTFFNIVITSSVFPSESPTNQPSANPTAVTSDPTVTPTLNPSVTPTMTPSNNPTNTPTDNPSVTPTHQPSITPSVTPTKSPSDNPTVSPTYNPTNAPTTTNPTVTPSYNPSVSPTDNPSVTPTYNPSVTPSISPITSAPSVSPITNAPTTHMPTHTPSIAPTNTPTTSNPSTTPTIAPTNNPSNTPTNTPTNNPSNTPTNNPSNTPTFIGQTQMPSTSPTTNTPTVNPSLSPSETPSQTPSLFPTHSPTTQEPSVTPTHTPTANPSLTPSYTPSLSPTTTEPSHNPSISPTNNPSETPSANPTIEPSLKPTDDPSHYPSIPPTVEPTLYTSSPTTNTPTYTLTIDPTIPETTTEFVTDYRVANDSKDNQTTELWSEDPYTYIFYGAIIFVAFLLIAMAVCCYCKFKPPIDEEDEDEKGIEYRFDIKGQSQTGKNRTLSIGMENTNGTNHHSNGYTNPNNGYDGPANRVGSHKPTHMNHRPKIRQNKNGYQRTQMVHVQTESHHQLNDQITEDIIDEDMSTGSATSDEEVLKGAYGGHITAGIRPDNIDDANPFQRVRDPRDQFRTTNDSEEFYEETTTNDNEYNNTQTQTQTHSAHTHTDTSTRDSTESNHEYDNGYDNNGHNHNEDNVSLDEEYEDDEYSDEYGESNAGHMTIGAPPDYPYNRHHVDGDEQYIVEMITKDELRRKVENSLKEKEMSALHNEDDEYAQNIFNALQQNEVVMNEIIHDMNHAH